MKSLVFAIPEKWNYGFNIPCNIGKNMLQQQIIQYRKEME